MKLASGAVTLALGVGVAAVAELWATTPAEALLVIPSDCVWIELSASEVTIASGSVGGIFAKHRELGRVEDLRPEKVEATIFDESTPAAVVSGPGGVVRLNGPRLPFVRLERTFASGSTRRPARIRSAPAELLVKRASDGSVQALWVDRATRFPLRFVTLRRGAFDWSEFYPVNSPGVRPEFFETGSGRAEADLRALFAIEIQQARQSFAALLAEMPWKRELEDLP